LKWPPGIRSSLLCPDGRKTKRLKSGCINLVIGTAKKKKETAERLSYYLSKSR